MSKKKNGNAAAVAAPNEVHYRGVRKQPSGRYGAAIRIPSYVWLGTFDTPQQAARVYDMAARKYHGHKAKTNFPLTNEDNLKNANYLNANNPNKRSDFGSSFGSRDELVLYQNSLLTCFPTFNSKNFVPLQFVLKEYYSEILKRGEVIYCGPKPTNYIQKEMTEDFNGGSGRGSDNDSGAGCEVHDQPPTILNSILTSLLPRQGPCKIVYHIS